MESFNHEEFAHWQELWDTASSSGDFHVNDKELPTAAQSDLTANVTTQDYYWNNLNPNEPEILNEEDKKTSNPIHPDSVGKDQEQPKPSWVKEDLLEAISEMKRKLYDLEVKLGNEDAGNGEWVEKCHHPDGQKIVSQIENLKKEIDDLSDRLGQEDEPSVSQWTVKS